MVIEEESKQLVLPYSEPACHSCPLRMNGRCRGAQTGFDILTGFDTPQSAKPIDCLDPGRILRFHHNLYLAQPGRAPDPPVCPDLPPFISVLKPSSPAGALFPDELLYGVSLSSLLLADGTLNYSDPELLRHDLGLSPLSRLALIGTGPDDYYATAWRRSFKTGFWEQIRRLRFEFSTSTTFSVWQDQSRSDQIYNQDRNFASYDFLTGVGVPTVPFLFPVAEEDFEAAAVWLEERPEIETIALLTQFFKDDSSFEKWLEWAPKLANCLPRPLKVLVVGCAAPQRTASVLEFFPQASFASGLPVQLALSGEILDSDLAHTLFPDLTLPQLAVENVLQCHYYFDRLANGEKALQEATSVPPEQIMAARLAAISAQRHPSVPSLPFDGLS